MVDKLVDTVWGNVAWHRWGMSRSRVEVFVLQAEACSASIGVGDFSMTRRTLKDAIVQRTKDKCMGNGKKFPEGDKVRGVDRQNPAKGV
jgi:hypothetical protein